MREETRVFLLKNAEKSYRDFSAALIPGDINMLGIRLPLLRKKAQELAKGDWQAELATEDVYFEEIMLRGMMLGYVKRPQEEMLPYIAAFVPRVDNWSVCDSVFSGMKVLREDRERTWEWIQPYLSSEREFEVRAGILIMMQHLLKCDERGRTIKRLRTVTEEDLDCDKTPEAAAAEGGYVSRILRALDKAFPQYYASMAAAWCVAEAFCCFPKEGYAFLSDNRMDDKTHNRALRKITESRIPTDAVKDRIRSLKRSAAL